MKKSKFPPGGVVNRGRKGVILHVASCCIPIHIAAKFHPHRLRNDGDMSRKCSKSWKKSKFPPGGVVSSGRMGVILTVAYCCIPIHIVAKFHQHRLRTKGARVHWSHVNSHPKYLEEPTSKSNKSKTRSNLPNVGSRRPRYCPEVCKTTSSSRIGAKLREEIVFENDPKNTPKMHVFRGLRAP